MRLNHLSLGLLLASLSLVACDGGSVGGDPPGDNTPTPVSDGAPAALDGGALPGSDALAPDLAPDQPEQCNGFDDDGDGQVDEGCGCKAGQSQSCFPGPVGPVAAPCQRGSQKCNASAEFGTWGPCTGAVPPGTEICGDGIDQDCDGKNTPCPGVSHCETFTFGKSARPVDIVWAIDQSGSMGDEIAMVRANMNRFASTIAGAKADYRVILVASRTSDPDNHQLCIPQPLAGPNCQNSSRFLQVDQHVDSHDALSRIIQHIGTIEGFMRKGSARRFVVVSDDDAEGTKAAAFHAFLKLRPGYADYKLHSIVALVDKGCAADEGKEYIKLSTLTGGMASHICSANWSQLFTQLGKEASTVVAQFKLQKTPKAGTLKVTVGGKPLAQGSGWTHDALLNQVVLKAPYPAAGTLIKVCYEY